MPTSTSEVMVARRYLAAGFLNEALRLFIRNAPGVDAHDWADLLDGLMARERIAEVSDICALAGIPLPRERLLALGDRKLRRRDIDGARHLYELGEADTDRWERVLDALTRTPEHQLLAIAVASKHLVGRTAESERTAPGSRRVAAR